jgi:hypothetical protein
MRYEFGSLVHYGWEGLAAGAGIAGGLFSIAVALGATKHYQLSTRIIDSSETMESLRFLQGLYDPLSIEPYFGGGIDYGAEIRLYGERVI